MLPGALDLDHATLACRLVLKLCCLEQAATLEHADIPSLDLSGTHLPRLNLDEARVEADVYCEGLTATGEVRAEEARIAGQLGLQKATLSNEGGTALSLHGAHIEGGAFWAGLTAAGEVRGGCAHRRSVGP